MKYVFITWKGKDKYANQYHQSYCTSFGFILFQNDAHHCQPVRSQRFIQGFDGRYV